MITVSQLLAAIQQHSAALPPGALARWCFLVTFEELGGLVDELQANPQFGMQFEPEQAEHIKEGRAGLNVNGTWVLPEYIEDGAIGRPPVTI